MTATDIEVDSYTITVTSGINNSDVVLATIGGAIKEITIEPIQTIGNITTYLITVVHDDVGTTALEWTSRTLAVTKGTTITDQVYGTIAGLAQQSFAKLQRTKDDLSTFDLIIVHLNA